MSGKKSPAYQRLLSLLLILSFPLVSLGLSVRLTFHEWFINYEYSKGNFPKDRWGMPDNLRKELAKLGLRAVLSEEGLEAFKKARLPDGRKAFNHREIKHMKDVNELLSILFPLTYSGAVLWIIGLAFTLNRAKVLMLSGAFSIALISVLTAAALSNYDLAFEVFHNLVFDPTSWRFRYTDTLLRIYPMKFWFDGTVTVVGMSCLLSTITLLVGGFLKKFSD